MTSFQAWRTRLSALGLFGALLVSAACGGANNTASSSTGNSVGNVGATPTSGPGVQGTPGSGIAPTATPYGGYPTPTPGPVTPRAAVYYTAANRIQVLNVDTGSLIWQQNLPGSTAVYQQPIIANGLVYFIDYNSVVEAADAHTGSHVWTSTAYPVEPPLVTSDMVYATEGDLATKGGVLIALDAHTGVQKWKQLAEYDQRTPMLWNGKVWVAGFMNSTTMVFYSYDPMTGQPGQTVTFNNLGFGNVPTQIVNGQAFFVCKDEVSLCGVDLNTGKVLWVVSDGQGLGDATVANGIVYCRTALGLVAVNATTGKTVFIFKAPDTSEGQEVPVPTVANGVVYFAMNGVYYAIQANNGALIWNTLSQNHYYLEGIYFDGMVLTAGPSISGIDAATGNLKWRFTTRGSTYTVSAASW